MRKLFLILSPIFYIIILFLFGIAYREIYFDDDNSFIISNDVLAENEAIILTEYLNLPYNSKKAIKEMLATLKIRECKNDLYEISFGQNSGMFFKSIFDNEGYNFFSINIIKDCCEPFVLYMYSINKEQYENELSLAETRGLNILFKETNEPRHATMSLWHSTNLKYYQKLKDEENEEYDYFEYYKNNDVKMFNGIKRESWKFPYNLTLDDLSTEYYNRLFLFCSPNKIYFYQIHHILEDYLKAHTIEVSYKSKNIVRPIITGDIDFTDICRILVFNKLTQGKTKIALSNFLYFSTVTITTLGYGDIIPNCTIVRMLVMIESIFGVVLSGIFIGALFYQDKIKLTRSRKYSEDHYELSQNKNL